MDISVTELKQRCLELVREVEATGKAVAITRRGRVVAQLEPAVPAGSAAHGKPWERMRGRGKWVAAPEETFLPNDPADRLIAATARAHALPLATHDRVIRRSRAVRIWKP